MKPLRLFPRRKVRTSLSFLEYTLNEHSCPTTGPVLPHKAATPNHGESQMKELIGARSPFVHQSRVEIDRRGTCTAFGSPRTLFFPPPAQSIVARLFRGRTPTCSRPRLNSAAPMQRRPSRCWRAGRFNSSPPQGISTIRRPVAVSIRPGEYQAFVGHPARRRQVCRRENCLARGPRLGAVTFLGPLSRRVRCFVIDEGQSASHHGCRKMPLRTTAKRCSLIFRARAHRRLARKVS